MSFETFRRDQGGLPSPRILALLACLDDDCAWIFGSESERADHVKTAHPGIALAIPRPEQEPLVACGVGTCDRTFGTKQAAAGHRFAAHKVRGDGSSAGAPRPTVLTPFKCKVIGCDRAFASEHGLEIHVARTHQTPSPAPTEKEVPMGEPNPGAERALGSDDGIYVSKTDRDALIETLGSIVLPNPGGALFHVGDLTENQRRMICLYDKLVDE